MLWVLAALAGLLALCRYLKTPRWVPLSILSSTAILVIAARFLLPPTHPVRENAGSDLDGLIVVIFGTAAGLLYLQWFRRLKPRTVSAAASATVDQPGFVLIAEDAALTRDVEALRGTPTERFSVLRRDASGEIAASGRAAVTGPVVTFSTLYDPEGRYVAGILDALEAEASARGATEALIGPVDAGGATLYQSLGYEVCARFDLADGPRALLRKTLA